MMKKIWGLMIILCCFFASVAFGSETVFNLQTPDNPAIQHSRVDVSIEKNGILTFQAKKNSLLKGKVNMKVTEKVTLLSGDYAGWGYAHIQYNTGKFKGSIYYVFNSNEGRGMLSGDIAGVAQQATGLESDMSLKAAVLDGAGTQTNIDLMFLRYKPGRVTEYNDIWMPVVPDFTLSANDYSQQTTVLLLPAPDGNPHNVRKFKGVGLEFGTYQSGSETGTLWSFLDNTELVDPPFNQRRYGTRDGVLAGTSETFFQNGAGGNSAENWSALLAE